MIPDEFYSMIFYGLITLVSITSSLPLLFHNNFKYFPKVNLVIGVLLTIIIAICFIGFRNPYGSWRYFGDTYNYTRKFLEMKYNPNWESNKDFGFYFYMKLISKTLDVTYFYLISAALYVGLPYYSFIKWLKEYSFFALVLYISSMSFWGFGINGLRNGLATSIFIFSLSFLDKKWIMYAIIFIAISFHKSILLPTAALTLILFYNNTERLIKIWLFSIPLSFVLGRKIQSLLSTVVASSGDLIDERAGNLVAASAEDLPVTSSSFRVDFIIYSGAIIYLGYYFIFVKKLSSDFYVKIFNIYIVANTVWILLIYAPFTNRTAYLSWFLMPILIAYPIIESQKLNNQAHFMLVALVANLSFTWLLFFI